MAEDDHKPATRADLWQLGAEIRTETKAVRDELKDDVRHLGAQLENFRGEVRVIAEGHTALNAKVDGLAATVGAMREDMRGIETRIPSALAAVIDRGARGVEERLARLEHDVAELKARPPSPPRAPRTPARRRTSSSKK